MEFISVFDMLKIGIGPSSSHTLGPWKAANAFVDVLKQNCGLETTVSVQVHLFGSLSLTGKGHASDIAVTMGLFGYIPEEISPELIPLTLDNLQKTGYLNLGFKHQIPFSIEKSIIFEKTFLDFHPNGITFIADTHLGKIEETYFSIGGGFILKEEQNEVEESLKVSVPYPIQNGNQLLGYCANKKISEIVWANELALRPADEINDKLTKIWETMLVCVFTGCHTEGTLPGGLNVKRRAFEIYSSLNGPKNIENANQWLQALKETRVSFREILKWVSCFAISVNEVNASLGRVVTAPTNGSAGVIPAVLMYYLMIENHSAGFEEIKRFLMVAAEIGSIFKKGATISAALGGCQAEIGVSSAMAAGALCELQGGTPEQVIVAAEIAMEHHLGLTCDPIAGLVQVPCIERNSMGAIKAINACELALSTDPKNTLVPLDKVIATMWQTAQDMNSKYKETSQGGLAVTVNMVDC